MALQASKHLGPAERRGGGSAIAAKMTTRTGRGRRATMCLPNNWGYTQGATWFPQPVGTLRLRQVARTRPLVHPSPSQ